MKLIIGLGNIGPEYEVSRHNAGFLSLHAWAKQHKTSFKRGDLYDIVKTRDACLIKPNTYMNRSGVALASALRKWPTNEVLVIHDDIELPQGKLRLRNGGGDGGHNGVKSLLEVMSADDLKRIRIGIGRDAGDPRDYVLDDFAASELEALQPALIKVCEFIDVYIRRDFNAVLDEYSKWNKSCSGETNSGNTSPKERNNG